jgi:two-component system response regulator RegA
MTAEERVSLMLVDDDATFRDRLARAFSQRGYDVCVAGDPAAAVRLAETESPELALLDLRMPGGSGLELVRDLVRIDPQTNVVVLTGYGSIATALEAVRLGATHYLSKPADVDEILAAFARKHASRDEVRLVPDEVPSLARTEWEHIHRVLTDVGGNVSQAARLLGVHRRSLQRKLAKYPVRR